VDTPDKPSESVTAPGALVLAGVARRAATGRVSSDVDAAGRARLLWSLERRRNRRAPRHWFAFATAAAAVAGLVAVSWPRARTTFRASEGEIAFSDGSKVTFEPGTRVGVATHSKDGTRLRIEAGRARFEVRPRKHGSWSVEAGPFVVTVLGTTFDVRWSAKREVVDVWLRKGAIKVEGPLTGEGITLSPGQHLHANLQQETIEIAGDRVAGTAGAAKPGAMPDRATRHGARVAPPVPSGQAVFSFDFEDGAIPPTLAAGQVVQGPGGVGGRFSVIGTVASTWLYNYGVTLSAHPLDNPSGERRPLPYSDDLVLRFDYTVPSSLERLVVQFYHPKKRTFDCILRDHVREGWGHATVRVRDCVSMDDKSTMTDGDGFTSAKIWGGRVGSTALYVDNIELFHDLAGTVDKSTANATR
jgi:hypothetical protein